MAEEKTVEMVEFDTALERLGLKRAELYRHLKDGKIKAQKEDHRLHFDAEEVEGLRGELQAANDELAAGLAQWLPFFGARLQGEAWGEEEGMAEKKAEERVAVLGERILADAHSQGADGLHLDPLLKGDRLLYSVEYRNSEVARFAPALSVPLKKWFAALAELPGEDEGKERQALGGREVGEVRVDFRLSAVPTLLGEHLHLHFFKEAAGALEAMGYTPDQAQEMRLYLDGRPGLIILAGAADALAESHRTALAHELSAGGRLVVSLEHRLHRRFELLLQVDLSQEGGPGFDALWRTALGMAPDAIFIDDIQNKEEARALVEGAQSGAVVVAQIRASSARHALESLKELGADPLALAEALQTVVERRTVRRLCSSCRIEQPASEERAVDSEGVAYQGVAYQAVGCERCREGYLGRLAFFGLHSLTPALAAWIRTPLDEAAAFPVALEGLDLVASLRAAVASGETSAEAARPFWGGSNATGPASAVSQRP
jgi:type II secretory ATPase GspE/PulE/Tfp pilus assembly ATPase PilB-like protein